MKPGLQISILLALLVVTYAQDSSKEIDEAQTVKLECGHESIVPSSFRIARNDVYNFVEPSLHIFQELRVECDGWLTQWRFLAKNAIVYGLHLAVFRERPGEHEVFDIAGESYLRALATPDGTPDTWVYHPVDKPIAVAKGDLLGYYYDSFEMVANMLTISSKNQFDIKNKHLRPTYVIIADASDIEMNGTIDARSAFMDLREPALSALVSGTYVEFSDSERGSATTTIANKAQRSKSQTSKAGKRRRKTTPFTSKVTTVAPGTLIMGFVPGMPYVHDDTARMELGDMINVEKLGGDTDSSHDGMATDLMVNTQFFSSSNNNPSSSDNFAMSARSEGVSDITSLKMEPTLHQHLPFVFPESIGLAPVRQDETNNKDDAAIGDARQGVGELPAVCFQPPTALFRCDRKAIRSYFDYEMAVCRVFVGCPSWQASVSNNFESVTDCQSVCTKR